MAGSLEVEAQVNRLYSISYRHSVMLLKEVGHWQWAVEQGFGSQEEAEAGATRRAARILHRLASTST